MRRWETRGVVIGGTYLEPIPREQGGRKDHPFEEYPKMLYRAESADGGPRICDFITVANPDEELKQIGRGWAPSQEAALGQVHVQQRELARLAANRAHNDRWMSDRAKAEASAFDETTMEHVAEIPAVPIKRRNKPGRKPKAAAVALGEG